MTRHGLEVSLLTAVNLIHSWDYYTHLYIHSLCPRGFGNHHGHRAFWLRCDSAPSLVISSTWELLSPDIWSLRDLLQAELCIHSCPHTKSAHQSPNLQHLGMRSYLRQSLLMNWLRISIVPFHSVWGHPVKETFGTGEAAQQLGHCSFSSPG